MKQNNRTCGSGYERAASVYLQQQDHRILERNFHAGKSGEIDLIAFDCRSRELVFAEVKFRRHTHCGLPGEAVTPAKQRTICLCAKWYLQRHGEYANYPIRFDVITITGQGGIEHLKNAFDAAGYE